MSELFTPEEQALLESRAGRLLGQSAALEADATARLVVFRRAQTRYALLTEDLLGVRALSRLTRMPQAPRHLVGLVHLDGRTVGVLDLERLERPDAPLPSQLWGVEVAHESKAVLLAADELVDLVDVPKSQLAVEPKGAFAGQVASRLRAILPGPVLVLDNRALLDPDLY